MFSLKKVKNLLNKYLDDKYLFYCNYLYIMYIVEYDIDSPITMSEIIGGTDETQITVVPSAETQITDVSSAETQSINISPTNSYPNDNVSLNTSNAVKTDGIENKKNKFMTIVKLINNKYSEFKKSLNNISELQNISKLDLYLLLPSNDEPYIDDEKVSKFITDKIINKNISIGKNDHTDNLPPFFSTKDDFIIQT
jgi:hypothetical protein